MSERRQLLMIVAAAVVVTILFFVVLVKPKLTEISEVREQVTAAEQEQAQLRVQLDRLQDLQRRKTTLTAQLESVSSLLPSSPELPNFIRLIQGAATGSGVNLKSIAPSAPTDLAESVGVQVITVTLVIEGGFQRVDDFFARVERLQRVALVKSLSLSPTRDELSGRTSLDTTLSLQMYVVQPNARVGAVPTPTASPSPGGS